MIQKDLKRRVDRWIDDNYQWLLEEIEMNVCKGQMKEYSSDLTTYLIESIYKLPEDKVTQMLDDGKLKWYLLRGAGMQLRSSTSPFYRTWRQHKMSAREDGIEGTPNSIFDKPWEEYDESLYQCFREQMDNMDFYDKALIDKYYYDDWTLQQIYEYYNISKRHIIKDINRILQQVRDACKHC